MFGKFDIEEFSVADAEYFKKLGFQTEELKRGLFHEQVSNGQIEKEIPETTL